MNTSGMNFIQNPCLSISSLIDGFIGMMELFIGGNTLITIGIIIFHMFWATRTMMATDSGQYNDVGAYCIALVILAIMMMVYNALIGGYMSGLNNTGGFRNVGEPEYKKITTFTFLLYIVSFGAAVTSCMAVFTLYFPASIQVFSPFDDTKVLKTISYWKVIATIAASCGFIFILFIINCCF